MATADIGPGFGYCARKCARLSAAIVSVRVDEPLVLVHISGNAAVFQTAVIASL